MNLPLVYGIRNGTLVTIDEVEKGLNCHCICPACKTPLIAKKGKLNQHHFAHSNSLDCGFGAESVFHLECKKAIERNSKLILPPLYFPDTEFEIHPSREIRIDKVELEKPFHGIIPDIVVHTFGKKLYIEIAVTHYISPEKLAKVKSLNIPMIEIHPFRGPLKELAPSTIHCFDSISETVLINGTTNKNWVHTPRLQALCDEFILNYSKKKIIQSFITDRGSPFDYVNDCPLEKRKWKSGIKKGHNYAKTEDCIYCDYCLDYNNKHLYCCGHHV